jgi:hypothetical protein
MNAFGVGAAFAIGLEISALTTIPEVDFVRLLMTMLVYGLIVGYIFQIWSMALHGVRLSAFAHGGRRSSDVVLKLLRAFFSRNRSS